MPQAERKARILAADGGVPQARSHLAFMRGGAARSAACLFIVTVVTKNCQLKSNRSAWLNCYAKKEGSTYYEINSSLFEAL